jgi:threonine/homoserine/homoserine lactone efflux protein
MNLADFVATVVIVTASGALAPGPLSFGIIMQGSKMGARSGFSCAIGHTLVEFPLVLALSLGLLAAASQPMIKSVIGLVGGLALIGFGIVQIYATLKTKDKPSDTTDNRRLPASSLVLGFALTGLNPYFILWWLTLGSALIVQAVAFGAIIGVLMMYVSHVWMDYAFLTALAYFAKKGKSIVGSKYYRAVLIAFGVVLVYFGLSFTIDAIRAGIFF